MSTPSASFAVALRSEGPPPKVLVRGEVVVATAAEFEACVTVALGPPFAD